ncbi:helix-turn-helix transcriptional regulator [Azospirillum sp. B4]|uniref:helix-turn-helix domain-containing protein n=1 Tax=Azospirillum sp. B4 TaxID=95605 RepID=UPI000347E64B|nr:helix-turn-helix transcriptional regulator [Azospirillum sp. B4]
MNALHLRPIHETPDSVTIRRIDYDALTELLADAEDLADAAAVAAKLQAGETEAFPAEVMDRLIEGDHPLLVFREFRGVTVRELATKAGVSRSYLSEVEKRVKPGSLDLMSKVASALGVPLELLVQ